MRTLLLVLVVSALSGATGARAAEGGLIIYRVTDTPQFLEATEKCPDGRAVATMRSPAGAVLGTSRLCVEDLVFTCEPLCVQRQIGTLTNTFAGGQIFMDVVFRDAFNADFTRAAHVARGRVTGGTGAYEGASGRLSGSGPVSIDQDFIPHPDLTYVIRIRRAAMDPTPTA